MALNKSALLLLSLFASWAASATPALAQSFVDPALKAGVLRTRWTRGPSEYQRSWQIQGPVDATQTVAQRNAAPGTAGWIPLNSWTDLIDLPRAPDRGQVLLARTTISRTAAGNAVLLLGCEGAVEVFLNDVSVHRRTDALPFAFDQERIPVELADGDNTLLLRIESLGAPARIALRTTAPGALVSAPTEISPTVETASADTLQIRTHHMSDPHRAPVDVAVIAPGGLVAGYASGPRGAIVSFDTSTWPDGPYEILCTTLGPWGDTRLSHLAWFKGDPRADIAALVEAANSAPSTPSGDTLRLLSAIVRDRIGDSAGNADTRSLQAVHSPLFEFRELSSAARGGAGGTRAGGFVRLAYTDPVDGSTQFCRAYLPYEYDPAKSWPLIIQLHGFNPENPAPERWWSVDNRHHVVADHCGAIVLEPHGRGNAQYLGIGEQDVLRALHEARQHFSVDDDRVYLTGESMGGHGTWSIASRHPDLFAAAAPIFGGWDFRLAPIETGGMAELAPANPLIRYTLETQSSFASAEGLLHVPLLVEHGDADFAVHVENSRFAVRQLERWGYHVRYREHPGLGHEDLGGQEQRARWLLQHRRVNAPASLRLRAPDLVSAEAYWLRVEAAERPLEIINVDAEFVRPGLLRLDTTNVAACTLSPPASLLDPQNERNLTVVWNGDHHDARLAADGTLRLGAPAAPPDTRVKSRGMEGGISNILTTPFIVVVGTTSTDPVTRRLCREKADAFAANWWEWQKRPVRMRTDQELTAEEERTHSLILIGGPDANSVTRRMEPKLPLRLTPGNVSIHDQTWSAPDACVQMIYPSPSAPARYVLVVAGTSPTGLYFWRPILWRDPHGAGTEQADWTLRDGRRVSLPLGRPATDSWIAAGVFDRNWQADPRWIVRGDDEIRAESPRRIPFSSSASTVITPAELNALAGRYQLAPGVAVDLRVKDGALWAEQDGRTPVRLQPEGDAGFGHPLSGTTYHFMPGPNERPAMLFINMEGTDLPFSRVAE